MHHQFNIQEFYALPRLYLCVVYLSQEQKAICATYRVQHKLSGFYNGNEMGLLRSMDWFFK
jgi:hypothetical protein